MGGDLNMNTVKNSRPVALLETSRSKKTYAGLVEQYLKEIRNELREVCFEAEEEIRECAQVLIRAKLLHNEVMFFGMEQDYHIINHANVDFFKMNNFRVISMGIPEITAFGNDYPFPDQLKEMLERRHFGKQDILVGVQFEENNMLLQEAFKYNYGNGGINVLISNTKEILEYCGINIFINSKNTLIARDIAQIILHFLSANVAYETDIQFKDEGARTFAAYCTLLLESLNGPYFSSEKMAEISMIIEKKLKEGNNIFTFGNGGSAAIASFVSDALRNALDDSLKAYTRIFDVTSFTGNITKSINDGYFKSDAFTRIIRSLGVRSGDLLLGISSSGNSENILHPFVNLEETVRVGILGFGNGGIIGTSHVADSTVIVPDVGNFKSYQRAEDGQRIAMSSIINTFYNKGRLGNGKPA